MTTKEGSNHTYLRQKAILRKSSVKTLTTQRVSRLMPSVYRTFDETEDDFVKRVSEFCSGVKVIGVNYLTIPRTGEVDRAIVIYEAAEEEVYEESVNEADNTECNKITIWVFKESGKWYTLEEYNIPSSLHEVYEIAEYVQMSFKSYRGMHLVLPLNEEFITQGYPCMIPLDRRR